MKALEDEQYVVTKAYKFIIIEIWRDFIVLSYIACPRYPHIRSYIACPRYPYIRVYQLYDKVKGHAHHY